ncbi:MAG: glycine C-acetyltransferase, partial [Bacteroidota bacterium]
MSTANIYTEIQQELDQLRQQGLYKEERIITTPQAAEIQTRQKEDVLNFCANNYLGLSSHPDVITAARSTIDQYGFGLSSVRFIC